MTAGQVGLLVVGVVLLLGGIWVVAKAVAAWRDRRWW